MTSGLIIANDGSDIEHENKYDSRLTKLTVDPDATPSHFGVINLSGGTRWTISVGNTAPYEEVLFRVKHNLPFIPQFQAYFYVESIAATSIVPKTAMAQYSMNKALLVYNAVSLGEESLDAEADTQYFYIYHRAMGYGYALDPWTVEGSNYQYRIRYFIFNQPGYIEPGWDTQRIQ